MSSGWRRPASWAAPRRSTHCAAVANATRCPARQARMPRAMERWLLPVPGGPRNTAFDVASMKSRAPRWATTSACDAALMIEVEVLQASCGPGSGRRGCGPHRRGTGGPTPPVRGRRRGTPRGSSRRPGPARRGVRPRPTTTAPSVPGTGRSSSRAPITPPPSLGHTRRGRGPRHRCRPSAWVPRPTPGPPPGPCRGPGR